MGDVEIVGRVERRRKWTPGEKAALLAEVDAEGGRVTGVARRHGISVSLLYNWRSAWKAAASMRSGDTVEFVPLGVIGQATGEDRRVLAGLAKARLAGAHRQDRVGGIEIDLPNGARVRVDAFVDEQALSRVFRAIRGVV